MNTGPEAKFNLSAWALKNQQMVSFFMLLVIAMGVFCYEKLPRNEDPAFTIKTAVVSAQWPGATVADTTRLLTDTLEKLLCQPHIHHRKLVHNDEVCIHKANALAIAHFFPGAKPQCAVQRAGFVYAGAFRHTAAGTACGSHKGKLSFRVQVLEHLDDGL